MDKNVLDRAERNFSRRTEKIIVIVFLIVCLVFGYFVHIFFYFLLIVIPWAIMKPDDDDNLYKLWDKEHRFKGLHGGKHG